MRIFIDANVLFSACHSLKGRSLALFRLAEIGRCSLCASSHVVEEARRNLANKTDAQMNEYSGLVELLERTSEAPLKLVKWAAEHDLGANDAPVLAAAVVSRADFLVTGDRTHFDGIFGRELGGVTVVTLCEALRRLLEAFDD